MKRAVKVSLKFVTAKKLRQLNHVLHKYRKLTNQYIELIWTIGGNLDKATINAVPCPTLSYRQRCDCLQQALGIVAATKASARSLNKPPDKPVLIRSVKFSSGAADVQAGKGSFDFVLRIASLIPRKRLILPFKSHARLNHWLAKGAKILDGCSTDGKTAVLWLDIPDEPEKEDGIDLGLDIGRNKLVVDSNGNQFGKRIKEICEKIRRKKPCSEAKYRACRERDDYIRYTVKRLPWSQIKMVAVEDLTGLKTGKKKNRGKAFRKMLASWTYRQVLTRIEQLAQENRVRLVIVDPRNTSRECPACGTVAKENRAGEKFNCVGCGYNADADHVGAINILARTAGNSRQRTVAGASKGSNWQSLN